MSWITDIFSGGVSKVVDSVGSVIDNLTTTEEEKHILKIELQKVLQKENLAVEETIRAELGAKERILVAELQQGDNYTKRARPTVVYFGLLVIFYNYCVIPSIQLFSGLGIQTFDLPTEFWVAWGGIVATWSVGRSAEKRGVKSKTVSLITGS